MTDETTGDLLKSVIRTVVPALVGLVTSWLARSGLHLEASTADSLTLLLVAVFTAGYYALVRWLTQRWAWMGWFLGYPANPTYRPRHAAASRE